LFFSSAIITVIERRTIVIKDFSNISEIKIISKLDCDENENSGQFLSQADIINKLISEGWIILHFFEDKVYLGFPKKSE